MCSFLRSFARTQGNAWLRNEMWYHAACTGVEWGWLVRSLGSVGGTETAAEMQCRSPINFRRFQDCRYSIIFDSCNLLGKCREIFVGCRVDVWIGGNEPRMREKTYVWNL